MIHSFNPDPNAPATVDHIVPSENYISMSGNWARRLLESELDVATLRPYTSDDYKRTFITQNKVGPDGKMVPKAVPTRNDANATLRFLDWILVDEAVVKAAKPRLRVVADLRSRGLTYNLPNGIAKTMIQFQQQSDITGATISMDALRQSESDRPVFSTVNFPVPIIHKDFQYSLRQILASRTGYSPLDTTTAELAARRVAEQVEQLALGCGPNLNFSLPGQFQGQSTYSWNGASVYGLMNYPGRITYSLTLPTTAGWTPQNLIDDILAMKKASQTAFRFGPWMVYTGMYWDPYLDSDYKATYNGETLRSRLRMIDGIEDVQTVDYIPDQSVIMVQMSSETIRLVIGMDIVTVQWESHGGMQLNFKVMCAILPQIRGDFYNSVGIVHAS